MGWQCALQGPGSQVVFGWRGYFKVGSPVSAFIGFASDDGSVVPQNLGCVGTMPSPKNLQANGAFFEI
jgi:hypothetical protein